MKTRTCFTLTEETLRLLKSLAFKKNISMAEVIREAIDDHLNAARNGKEKPDMD